MSNATKRELEVSVAIVSTPVYKILQNNIAQQDVCEGQCSNMPVLLFRDKFNLSMVIVSSGNF